MYKDFQVYTPVFVRSRHKTITWRGNTYNYNQQVPWRELNIPEENVRIWFKYDMLYHNPELEKENQVGDRLGELSSSQLETLYNLLNAKIKSLTNSNSEYNKKKVRRSKIDERQRALIRTWLRNNEWAEDYFYEIRDDILKK